MSAPVHRRRGVLDDVRSAPRTVADFLVDGGRHLFVEPVRNGRPRLDGRSPGTTAVVAAGVVGYVACLAIVVFGGPLRAHLALSASAGGGNTLSLPRDLLWLVITLVVLGFSLLQTGALHAPVWLRVIVGGVTMLGLAFVGTADVDTGGLTASMIVGFLGAGAILVFQVVRWRRAPQWWEFVVVLGVITTVFTVAYSGARATAITFGLDSAPGFTTLTFFLLGQLAVPMTIVSGISAAEVGVSATVWSTTFLGRRLSLLVVGLVALGLWLVRARDAWRAALSDDEPWRGLVGAAIVALTAAVLWLALDRIADRRAAGSSRIGDVVSDVQSVALPVAVALGITAVPSVLLRLTAQIVFAIDRDSPWTERVNGWTDAIGSERFLLVTRVLAGLLFVAGAARLAVRGRRGPAELLGIIGLLLLASYATQDGAVLAALGGWDDSLDLIGVIAVAVVVAIRVRRTTVTTAFLGHVLLLVMLTVLLTQRDFVSNPLSIVLGFAGVGFVLFGYVWNYITGADSSNHDSVGFPRDSRVLLFTALNLFGVTVLAWAALTRSTDFGTDLGAFAALGDQIIGVPIIVAAFAASVSTSLRGDHG